MSELVELGSGTYRPDNGQWDGNLDQAAAQLAPGDHALMKIAFPIPINFIPADWISTALGPLFAAGGNTLEGVDFDGDSTLVLAFRVGA